LIPDHGLFERPADITTDIDSTMVAQSQHSLSHCIQMFDVAVVLCRMHGKLVLAAAVLLAFEGCDAAPLGKWGGVKKFPLVPVAAALLPDGKVNPTMQWHMCGLQRTGPPLRACQ
jgi:hypothetical protein